MRHGVGYETVNIEDATKCGIPVAILPGANAEVVAELAVGLMLSVLREICKMNTLMHDKRSAEAYYSTSSLIGKTVGVLGMGAIGRAVIRFLEPFHCKFLAYDLMPNMEFAKEHNVKVTSMEEVLSQSDIISVHLPMTPETKWTINKNTIELMKPEAIVINTSRGGLICSDDLAAALKAGRIKAAGLDVLENEAQRNEVMGHQFVGLENVVLTPHVASATFEAFRSMMDRAMEVIECYRAGKPIPGLLTPDYVNYIKK